MLRTGLGMTDVMPSTRRGSRRNWAGARPGPSRPDWPLRSNGIWRARTTNRVPPASSRCPESPFSQEHELSGATTVGYASSLRGWVGGARAAISKVGQGMCHRPRQPWRARTKKGPSFRPAPLSFLPQLLRADGLRATVAGRSDHATGNREQREAANDLTGRAATASATFVRAVLAASGEGLARRAAARNRKHRGRGDRVAAALRLHARTGLAARHDTVASIKLLTGEGRNQLAVASNERAQIGRSQHTKSLLGAREKRRRKARHDDGGGYPRKFHYQSPPEPRRNRLTRGEITCPPSIVHPKTLATAQRFRMRGLNTTKLKKFLPPRWREDIGDSCPRYRSRSARPKHK